MLVFWQWSSTRISAREGTLQSKNISERFLCFYDGEKGGQSSLFLYTLTNSLMWETRPTLLESLTTTNSREAPADILKYPSEVLTISQLSGPDIKRFRNLQTGDKYILPSWNPPNVSREKVLSAIFRSCLKATRTQAGGRVWGRSDGRCGEGESPRGQFCWEARRVSGPGSLWIFSLLWLHHGSLY